MAAPDKAAARRLEVRVDHNVCVGNAMCVDTAPDAFELDDQRRSVTRPAAAAVGEKTLTEAAVNCPVSAIIVRDADTGEQIFP